MAEVGYLLGSKAGPRAEAAFLRSLSAGDFVVEALTAADYHRMGDLVEQYANLPLGTTDAAAVAIAERLKCAEVATLDQRDFTVVRSPARLRICARAMRSVESPQYPRNVVELGRRCSDEAFIQAGIAGICGAGVAPVA